MVYDYGGPYPLHSTHILHSAGVSQQQWFDGYLGQEVRRVQHQHLQHNQHWLGPHPYLQPQPQPQFHLHPHPYPLPSAQSHDWHGVVQREIEKERIRQEIIMSEILRRRALEAEVRRELMMEGETALRRGGSGFPLPLGSPSPRAVDMSTSPPLAEMRAEERFLDERSTALAQRHIWNSTREGGRSEPLPFQRASNDVRTTRDSTAKDSEIKPVSEGSNEKKKIILLAKPIKNISGAKRARSGSVASEPQSDGNSKKKKKKKKKTKTVNGEWSCALCQVIAPNERNLNEHLEGKKHKKKEAAQQAQHASKSSKIGLWTKKVAEKPIKGSETSNPVTEVKLAPEPLPIQSTDGPRPLQGSPDSDNLKKDETVVTKKETFQFWCEICKVGPPTKIAMEIHQQGKRHKRAVERTRKFWCEICEVGLPTEKAMKVHQQGRRHKLQLQNRAVEKTVAEDARVVKELQEKTMEEEDKVAVEKTMAENQLTMVDVADGKQLLLS